MGNFNRDNKRSGGRFDRGGFDRNKSFGGPKRFGGRDGARSSMHQATCSECGKACEIPFKPTGDRPVFCSVCFEKQGNSNRPSKFSGDRHEKFRFEDKQMHSAVCDKCGQTCSVPFRPTAGKPIFCDSCFGKGGNVNNNVVKDSNEVMRELKAMNTKLDQLLKALLPKTVLEKNEASKTTKMAVTPKLVVKEKTKKKVAVKKVVNKKKKK